jgi:hypothetical protein
MRLDALELFANALFDGIAALHTMERDLKR